MYEDSGLTLVRYDRSSSSRLDFQPIRERLTPSVDRRVRQSEFFLS